MVMDDQPGALDPAQAVGGSHPQVDGLPRIDPFSQTRPWIDVTSPEHLISLVSTVRTLSNSFRNLPQPLSQVFYPANWSDGRMLKATVSAPGA
jgi:hypothetical protein